MNLETELTLLKDRIKDEGVNESLSEDLTLLAVEARENGVEYETEYEHSVLRKLSTGTRLNPNLLRTVVDYVSRYDESKLNDLVNKYVQ